jgi:hypothetical protein
MNFKQRDNALASKARPIGERQQGDFEFVLDDTRKD